MAAGSDVKDILDIAGSGEKEFMTKDALMNSDKRVKKLNGRVFHLKHSLHQIIC